MEPDVVESEVGTRGTSAARRPDRRPLPAKGNGNAAMMVVPLLEGLFGDHMPVRFEFWDGSGTGPTDGPGTLVIRSPDAISRMLWAPGELGMGRAYVAGELEAEGDIFGVLQALHDAARPDLRAGPRPAILALRATLQLGVLGRPPAPPTAVDTQKAATPRRSATTTTSATSSTA